MPAVQHIFLIAAVVIVMIRFKDVVLRGGYCLSCGGHGNHRDDCPLRDDC